jgi:tetrahydromethanopterin S-methyltransferase subunit G
LDEKELIKEYFREVDKRKNLEEKKVAEKEKKGKIKQKRDIFIKSIFTVVIGLMLLYLIKMISDIFSQFLL